MPARWFGFLLALMLASSTARAQDDKDRARAEFAAGTALAQGMRWGEALVRFETSARLHAHPGTTYNIGVCHRALGHFTRAERAFRRALAGHEVGTERELPEHMLSDTRAFLDENARVLARIDVELSPAGARLAFDGRPLERTGGSASRPELTAGLLAPGPGNVAPARRFVIVADPGTHVIVLSRKGYADVVRRVDLAPGSRTRLELALERLPGQLDVRASPPGAVVSVNGLDVGVAPVSIRRPAGPHRVLVRKADYVSYQTVATLSAGERVRLDAELEKRPVALTERWWFWTGLGVAITGITIGTYYATRPEPERPAVPQGSLGWSVDVP